MRLTGLTGPYFPTGNRGLGLDEGSRIETRAQRGQALSLMVFSWSSALVLSSFYPILVVICLST